MAWPILGRSRPAGLLNTSVTQDFTCFAKPVELGNKRKLAVIGGRAFVKSSDYQQLMERFRTGDLQNIASDEVFANILFSESQRVGESRSESIVPCARLHSASSNGSGVNHSRAHWR